MSHRLIIVIYLMLLKQKQMILQMSRQQRGKTGSMDISDLFRPDLLTYAMPVITISSC